MLSSGMLAGGMATATGGRESEPNGLCWSLSSFLNSNLTICSIRCVGRGRLISTVTKQNLPAAQKFVRKILFKWKTRFWVAAGSCMGQQVMGIMQR